MSHSSISPPAGRKKILLAQVFAQVAIVSLQDDGGDPAISIELDWADAIKRLTDLVKTVFDAKAEIEAGKGFVDSDHVVWKLNGNRSTIDGQLQALADTLADRSSGLLHLEKV